MPYYEGPRRQGRFLKKGSKVLDRVSLLDFSFEEINDAPVIDLDNAKRTIVHSQYHSEKEIEQTVKTPEKFNDDLIALDQKRTVILPMDFTKEWERDRRSRKDRAARSEDEEFDFEYDAAVRFQEHQAGKEPEGETETQPTPVVESQPQVQAEAPKTQETSKKEAPKQTVGETPKYESMDVVGQAIKSLMVSAPETPAAEFIPVNTKTDTPEPAAVEDTAAMSYKQRVEQQQIDQKKLDELVEEAKAKGYRDGFGVGEEKGELQVRQNAQAIFGKMAELMQEFSGLKHEILNNVQQNFYELCQAMAEALIKREFSIHPDTFVTVLRRAISEAVEPGKFKIRVHPEFFEKLSSLGDQEIREALVKDMDVEPGDFKIESNMSVVDVSIKKMISDLLAQADLTLFQDDKDEKVS
jgi:flagellar biosynthesis/type III secretory pathway protein FliH